MSAAAYPLVAGVELGGTKSIALLARGTEIVAIERWPTLAPAQTLPALSERIAAWQRAEPIAALGIASFGPLGLDPARSDFGQMLNTPKPGWSGAEIRGHFAGRFDLPIGFDTDVAGAALAEGHWGAAIGCPVHVYLTIGTGVGAGLVVDGRPVHGTIHPEIGHLRVRRVPGDSFPGNCPFHGDCIEGLIAGPAIAARVGRPGEALTPDDPIWEHVAAELAELLAALILTLTPHRIVIGGGVVIDHPTLLSVARRRVGAILAGYLPRHEAEGLARLIVAPGLGADAGPLGAAALALHALDIAR